MTTPVVAFITFNSDDSFAEAVGYKKESWVKKRLKEQVGVSKPEVVIDNILGKTPEFSPSTEPTNIIWENRHIKGVHFGARMLSALIVITFMLCLTFSVIFLAKQFAIRS